MAVTTQTKSQASHDYGRFDFMGKAPIFVSISVIITIIAVASMLFRGFEYGVDFAGGIEMQVQFKEPVEVGAVRKMTTDLGVSSASVTSLGGSNEVLIRMEAAHGKTDSETNQVMNELISKVRNGLTSTFSKEEPNIRRVESVGPQVGTELKQKGILAAFYALIVILIYVGLRFDYSFATSAVLCLFHDTLVTLGVYSLLGMEVNVQTMAAVLTLIGYSLNDTIVCFDRIRENLPIYKDRKLPWIINKSMNDVFSRTILTSLTTGLAVISMLALAGGVIRDFSLTMAIGIVIGSYSSIYVASPMFAFLYQFQNKKTARA